MWQCPNCGESIEQQFDVCWNCGSDATGAVDPSFVAEPQEPIVPDPGITRVTDGSSSQLATDRNPLGNGLTASWRWFRHRSHWFIALTTLAFLFIASAPLGLSLGNSASEVVFVGLGVSLFIPGAIRRGNLRHVFAMGALGVFAHL